MKIELIQIRKEAGCVKIRNSKGMLYQFESAEMSLIAISLLSKDAILDYFNTLCEQHQQFVINITIETRINHDE